MFSVMLEFLAELSADGMRTALKMSVATFTSIPIRLGYKSLSLPARLRISWCYMDHDMAISPTQLVMLSDPVIVLLISPLSLNAMILLIERQERVPACGTKSVPVPLCRSDTCNSL